MTASSFQIRDILILACLALQNQAFAEKGIFDKLRMNSNTGFEENSHLRQYCGPRGNVLVFIGTTDSGNIRAFHRPPRGLDIVVGHGEPFDLGISNTFNDTIHTQYMSPGQIAFRMGSADFWGRTRGDTRMCTPQRLGGIGNRVGVLDSCYGGSNGTAQEVAPFRTLLRSEVVSLME